MNGTSCGFMAKIWAIWGTLILPRLLPIFLGDVPFRLGIPDSRCKIIDFLSLISFYLMIQ